MGAWGWPFPLPFLKISQKKFFFGKCLLFSPFSTKIHPHHHPYAFPAKKSSLGEKTFYSVYGGRASLKGGQSPLFSDFFFRMPKFCRKNETNCCMFILGQSKTFLRKKTSYKNSLSTTEQLHERLQVFFGFSLTSFWLRFSFILASF